jgi:hypothetical protein
MSHNRFTVVGTFDDNYEAGDFFVETHPGFQARGEEFIFHLPGEVRELYEEEKKELILDVLELAYNQWAAPATRRWHEITFHFLGDESPRNPTEEEIAAAKKAADEYNRRNF